MHPIVQHLTHLLQRSDDAGVTLDTDRVQIRPLSGVHKVVKPWGYELWLSDGTKTPYALKLIYLMAGTKTSLQYHNEKSEHNCLVAGMARLHYQNPATQGLEVTELHEGHVISVLPGALHRIEAVTDVLLIEASSAHLDDVVRVEDDWARSDGRVPAEHGE